MSEITTVAGYIDLSPQMAAEAAESKAKLAAEIDGDMRAIADHDRLRRAVKLRREIRQALAELELVSEVDAVEPRKGSRDTSEDIGGRWPSGMSKDHPDVRELEDYRAWPLKPVAHYRRRVARARSISALEAILKDVRSALERSRRQPAPTDAGHPMPGDSNWKRWVAESSLSATEIARKCSVSKRYVNKVREQYRDRMAA